MDYTNAMKLFNDFYQFETKLKSICDRQVFVNAIQNILEWNTMLFKSHEVVIFCLFHAKRLILIFYFAMVDYLRKSLDLVVLKFKHHLKFLIMDIFIIIDFNH